MARLTIRDSVIATIVYADIFDYALTEEEVFRWMPFVRVFRRPRPASRDEALRKRIHHLTADGVTYYSVRSTKRLITTRKKRSAWSSDKWNRAACIARLLRVIPTIRLVGVTGGLAMNNAKQDDDMDLFFITSSGTLWVTRLLSTLIAELLGVRRKPGDTNFVDKICLNMFMADDALTLSKEERDMFAAHEVLQMVPLWNRRGAYPKFLRANQWVRKFLPNAWAERYQGIGVTYYGKRQNTFITLIHNTSTIILRLFEPVARTIQLWYMKKRRTNEVISNSVIRFHPRDARVWVKRALARRLDRLNIPLDKVFYGR